MSLPVVLRVEARAEFDEAFDWYEQQRVGLGVDFIVRVQEVFDRIADSPRLYPEGFQDIRRATVRRFPYAVLYRIEAGQILVIAVFRGKRDPHDWQARS